MHGAKNLNPVITLKNLLPPGRGPMLRDGPALAIPDGDGETGPATRLWRKGILIPDLMVAFEINIAGVIALPARLPHVEIAWRPRVPGVGGRSRGNPRLAPGGADMECLHAMRTLAMVLLEDPDYPLDVWSSFYRAVNQGLAYCGCPGQFFVLPEQMRDEQEPE